MSIMRNTSISDKSLGKEFFYLEKLVAPQITDEMNIKSLIMLLSGFDTQILHSNKLLEKIQTQIRIKDEI